MMPEFSLERFSRLFVTDLTSNAKKYSLWFCLLIGILATLVIILIISTHNQITDPEYNYQAWSSAIDRDPVASVMTPVFYFALFISCMIAASCSFQNLATKTSRINSLMLPAAPLEKFLSRVVIFVPLFLVAYLVSFQVIDWVRFSVEVILFGSDANVHSLNVWSMFFHNQSDAYDCLWFLVCMQSLFVLGSAVWPKNSLMKTWCAILIFGLLFSLFVTVFGNAFCPNLNGLGSFVGKWFDNAVSRNFTIWGFLIITYLLAYFRYKEIEIIQRW